MTKQQIHAWVDHTTYLHIKSNVKNLSGLINQLLNAYIENEQIEVPEEVEIIKKIDEHKQRMKESKEQLSQLSVMLAKVRADAEQQAKHDEEIKKDQHYLMRHMLSAHERGNL